MFQTNCSTEVNEHGGSKNDLLMLFPKLSLIPFLTWYMRMPRGCDGVTQSPLNRYPRCSTTTTTSSLRPSSASDSPPPSFAPPYSASAGFGMPPTPLSSVASSSTPSFSMQTLAWTHTRALEFTLWTVETATSSSAAGHPHV
ncbi:unnamed protein product [Triticum turgidum subsp. durum]|uniref:Uncharacterized protein n=1 Tax=Triticum turgidum subsp. durum TaxID=4567 RepID=A0A9R0QQ35_TRITD|nr:unnamed protein product [Triticum turgidum subsp. durum]